MPLPRLIPLALLALTAAAPAGQRIDVALSNFAITPATIQLTHGQHYVLHLSSKGGHSFAAKAFFTTVTMPISPRTIRRPTRPHRSPRRRCRRARPRSRCLNK